MQGPIELKNTSKLIFEMYPPLKYSNEITTSVYLVFNMTYEYVPDESIPHTYIRGDELPYGYKYEYMTEPCLTDGAMEVLIW